MDIVPLLTPDTSLNEPCYASMDESRRFKQISESIDHMLPL